MLNTVSGRNPSKYADVRKSVREGCADTYRGPMFWFVSVIVLSLHWIRVGESPEVKSKHGTDAVDALIAGRLVVVKVSVFMLSAFVRFVETGAAIVVADGRACVRLVVNTEALPNVATG
jgi:hypothetical protein